MTFIRTLVSVILSVNVALAARAEAPDSRDVEFFEKQVRPVLVEHCQSCHGPSKQKLGLRLDSRTALLKGSDSGPVVVPGDPDQSSLIRAIRYQGETRMPPKGKLPDEAIQVLTLWVKHGAVWPEATVAGGAGPTTSPAQTSRSHWAFQPVKKTIPPAVQDVAWCQNPIDHFIQARLEAAALAPAPRADKRVLLRRATFDLTGLPPTPEEVARFEADTSPDAFARVVDRLLASPAYGERWGRHWLDVARYADTKGYVFQEERRYPYAYTYRDYVIRAFNEDLPYDQFIIQQLAADALPLGDDKRPLAAMGFLTLGRRFLNNKADITDDRIDVVCRGLLGLTVGCARCHDHKFDPIPTKDYYSLYGVFASSTEAKDLPLIGEPERNEAYAVYVKELEARERKVADFLAARQKDKGGVLDRKDREQLTALRRQVENLNATSPAAPPRAMVLQDLPTPQPAHVFVRGNPNNPGEQVPRQFLQVLAGDQRQPFTHGSGRLDLAQTIASKDNPLTARVLVNRVWLHHFGAGLVRTPSDFGLRSDPPTHPELLDYLAATFMEHGWSIKHLHRLILLSATYQQSSEGSLESYAKDPENRLLSRINRRRLEFEELRDALLAVSGRLDRKQGGRAVELTTTPYTPRRTVYGFIDRQNLPGLFRNFDFASPDSSSPQRFTTTVPQQALFLMNHPFVVEQARRLVARPDVAAVMDPEGRIHRLYRLLYGRAPEAEEAALGLRFVQDAHSGSSLGPWEEYAQVLLLANEFAFVD